jgi:hypothetical protein
MACKKGDYLGGIRSVEDLRARSFVDPDTGCWHWRMGLSAGAPRVHICIDGKHTAMRGRRAALLLADRLNPGQTAFARITCRSDDCVNPDHCRSGTRSQHGSWLTQSGRYVDSVARKVAPFKSRAARARKLDIHKAREIRASDETLEVLSLRHGVCKSVVQGVKANRLWRETGLFDGILEAA